MATVEFSWLFPTCVMIFLFSILSLFQILDSSASCDTCGLSGSESEQVCRGLIVELLFLCLNERVWTESALTLR